MSILPLFSYSAGLWWQENVLCSHPKQPISSELSGQSRYPSQILDGDRRSSHKHLSSSLESIQSTSESHHFALGMHWIPFWHAIFPFPQAVNLKMIEIENVIYLIFILDGFGISTQRIFVGNKRISKKCTGF